MDSVVIPKHRVELHVHLEGSIRLETILELSQKKGLNLAKDLEDLKLKTKVTKPTNLADFLKPISDYLPAVIGDAEAIERIAYEFCQDSANQGVLYSEVRYSPHLLSSTVNGQNLRDDSRTLSPSDVVQCVNKGLEKGSREFGVNVKSILCTIRAKPGWSGEVAKLANEFRYHGVVAIDIAGHDDGIQDTAEEDVAAFKLAKSLHIHRTAHAGEDGDASQVQFSLDHLHAERIGHGYKVLDDAEIYYRCLKDRVHFENCPYSSTLTGSVDISKVKKHPIVRFAEDGANFSINRDDPTVIQRTLSEEYDLLRSWGLTDLHFVRANFNAARSSFLPSSEKNELIQKLKTIYGIEIE